MVLREQKIWRSSILGYSHGVERAKDIWETVVWVVDIPSVLMSAGRTVTRPNMDTLEPIGWAENSLTS